MSSNEPQHILQAPYLVQKLLERSSKEGFPKALSETAQLLVDRPLYKVRDLVDSSRDRRICGISLEDSVASPYGASNGAVDSIHSPYGSLEEILGSEKFNEDDVFLDVGCGKGRPLAYLVGRKFPGRLVGVELTSEVARYAQSWAQRFENVEVVEGDALMLDVSPFSHYFMFIPMTAQFSRAFIQKIEAESQRRVRLYYLCDIQDGDYIDAREGWSLVRRGWVYRKHGIPLHGAPQRYSIWDYERPAG